MDKKIIFIDNEKNFRIYSCSFKETLKQILVLHDLSPQMSFITGKIGIIAQLLSLVILKNREDVLILQVECNPQNSVNVYISKSGTFKVSVENPLQTGHLKEIFTDKGKIHVIKNLKGHKTPVSSIIEKDNFSIEKNFIKYFRDSEQNNFILSTDIQYDFKEDGDFEIRDAGGFCIIPFPDISENILNYLEFHAYDNINILENCRNDPLNIVENYFDNMAGTVIAEENIFLKCNCSYNNAVRMAFALNKEEIEPYFKDKNKDLVIHCNFCHKEYRIKSTDIENIYSQK